MLARLLRFDVLLPLMLLAGVAQYGMIAYSAIVSGSVPLWTLDFDTMASSGVLRYIKDAAIAGIALAWVIILPNVRLPRKLTGFVKIYFWWLACVVFIGVIGFILGYSPVLFLPAGLRWVLLLHAALGVFILSATLVVDKSSHKYIFRFLLTVLLIDGYAVLLQFKYVSSLFQLAIGASIARLTGLFSNATVAAHFALEITLFALILDGVSVKKRLGVSFLCLLLALATGTRFATAAIFLIILIQFREIMVIGGKQLQRLLQTGFVPLAFAAIFFGYQALNTQIGRGDVISQQFEQGGRAATFLATIEMLSLAEPVEVLFGRGLGVGTNTAVISLTADGINPSTYRFNLQVDNAFLTAMFQIGLIGSILFWFGIWRFIKLSRPKYSSQAKHRYFAIVAIFWVSVITGNTFEYYFLMMGFAAALGGVYWSDRIAYHQLRAGMT